MSDQLQGKRIAFLVANEGSREVRAFDHLDKADTFEAGEVGAVAEGVHEGQRP